MRSKIPNPISWCWARGAPSRRSKSGSWACCPARPLVARALAVYAQAYGIPEDRWPDFAQEFRPVAEAQVRRDLILDWVVEHHGLRATEAELEQKLQEIATRRGTSVAEVRATLEKAKRLRDLERGLTEEKVFTFLLSESTVEPA